MNFLEKKHRGAARRTQNQISLNTWACAAQCYHGGLNIAFALGLSPEGANANSDAIRPGFRFDVGHRSDLIPATIPR